MKKSILALLLGSVLMGSACAETILVGTDAGLAPFEYKDEKTNEIVGFDIDLIKAVIKANGDEPKIQNMQFAGIIPAIQTNMVDVAACAMTITPARQKQVNFSDPYYDVGLAMVIKSKDKNKYKTIKDLEGKRVCAQIGSTGSIFAKEIKGVKVIDFDQVIEAFMDLKYDGCQAAIVGKTVIDHYLARHNDKEIMTTPELYNPKQVGFAVAKSNKKMLNKLNKGLKTIKANGEYDKIYQKWFGTKH